jgi:putative DNA primase/helicase
MSDDRAAADAIEIVRLAALPPIECDRQLHAAAKKLGCTLSTLRRQVEAVRGNGAVAKAGQGRPLDLHEPEPWPDPVDNASLLADLAAGIRQYVILTEHQADATALWAVFTHVFDAFDFSPKLNIGSVEKRSGKTRLIEVLDRIVRKPLFVSGISAAALLRVIDQHVPCMLLDEIDTMMKGGDVELREALRGLINSGFDRAGARFIKNVPRPGGGYEPQSFSTWCPMLLAGIGKLPDTVADRSIRIELKRKRPDEKVKPLRAGDGAELRELGRKAARWAADNLDSLRHARPGTPRQLHDRATDAWSPLFVIADAAGGAWPERARRAAVELTPGGDDQDSIRVAVLVDIRAAFAATEVDRIASEDLAAYLASLDDRPWPEYRNSKPISKAQIARLLKPLGISSGTIRLSDGHTAKGYYRRVFDDAFIRYLPPENVTPSQPQDFRGLEAHLKTSHGSGCDVSEFPETSSIPATCDGVTDREAPANGDDNEFEERAAIREYLGGYPRAEAERLACADLAVARRPVH